MSRCFRLYKTKRYHSKAYIRCGDRREFLSGVYCWSNVTGDHRTLVDKIEQWKLCECVRFRCKQI